MTLVVLGGFILPLVEEIAFRLSLVFNAIYFSLSTSVLSYYFFTKVIFATKISAVDESFVTRVGISLAIGSLLFVLLKTTKLQHHISRFWSCNFRYIYYASSLIFAWMHISKYEVNLLHILLLPIFTFPQLMSGIIYGYTRVAFGFKYPLFVHCSLNTVALSLSFVSSGDLFI
nr:CPBP family intramembrane metalloprotease [Fulvivirga aurantia]